MFLKKFPYAFSYLKEMEMPIKDMKRFLDGILHICDAGRTAVKMGDLFGMVTEAENRLADQCGLSANGYVVQRALGYAPRIVQPGGRKVNGRGLLGCSLFSAA